MNHYVEEGIYWRVCMDCNKVIGVKKTDEPHMLNQISHSLCEDCYDKRNKGDCDDSECD